MGHSHGKRMQLGIVNMVGLLSVMSVGALPLDSAPGPLARRTVGFEALRHRCDDSEARRDSCTGRADELRRRKYQRGALSTRKEPSADSRQDAG